MQPSYEILSWTLLALRAIMTVVFFAHGAQKVFGWYGGHGLKGTAGFFKSAWGIPIPLGYLWSFGEFFGSIALALGVLTRITALGFLIGMLVAVLMAHRKHFFMNWGSEAGRGEGFEYSLSLAVIALVLIFLGGGAYSIDALY